MASTNFTTCRSPFCSPNWSADLTGHWQVLKKLDLSCNAIGHLTLNSYYGLNRLYWLGIVFVLCWSFIGCDLFALLCFVFVVWLFFCFFCLIVCLFVDLFVCLFACVFVFDSRVFGGVKRDDDSFPRHWEPTPSRWFDMMWPSLKAIPKSQQHWRLKVIRDPC